MEHAPTIDLSSAFGGTDSDRLKVAMQIDSACRATGFFVAIGHGVEETLLENCMQQLNMKDRLIVIPMKQPFNFLDIIRKMEKYLKIVQK